MNPEDVHATQAMIAAGIREALNNPAKFGLIWRRLPATVVDGSDPTAITLVIDGDEETLTAVSLIGTMGAGSRAMVDAVPPQGLYVIGWQGTVPGYRFLESVHFTATGTFTQADYPGLVAVVAEVQGGGGGSGGTAATGAGQSAVGSGAGAGGYARKLILASALSAAETVTVGTGGTAGTAGANNGGAGNPSTFSTVTANGGALGVAGAAGAAFAVTVGGVGGTATGGDLNIQGGDGGMGSRLAANPVNLSFGGSSQLGGSTRTGNTGQSAGGRLYGGGSAGPWSVENTVARAGTVGADGIVILHLYV